MIIDGLRNLHNYVNDDGGAGDGYTKKVISAFKNIRRFQKTLEFLRESQWQSTEWHRKYQKKKLNRLLKFASEKVPYYSDFINDSGLNPDGSDFADKLGEFPILNESEIKLNFAKFITERAENEDYLQMALNRKYSGQFHLPVDADTFLIDKALIARHYENAGYRIGSTVLCFVYEIDDDPAQLYKMDKANNRIYFSSNNICRRNLAEYCKKIKETNAGYLFGFPGSLEVIADFILEWEIDMKFQGIITSGEVLTENIRFKVEKAFNAKVYDLYHYAAPVLGMGQCQYCEGYHLFSEYCALELVDFDGNQIIKPGKAGRLVVTNTVNHAFPIIRYDTGDIGIFDGGDCDCGRGLPKIIKKIEGSQKQLLVDVDGGYIFPAALQNLFSESGYPEDQYQLVQKNKNKFKLKLVRGSEDKSKNLNDLQGKLKKRLGENSEFEVETVNRISGDGNKSKSIVREYEPG